jgi:hypothetical protein
MVFNLKSNKKKLPNYSKEELKERQRIIDYEIEKGFKKRKDAMNFIEKEDLRKAQIKKDKSGYLVKFPVRESYTLHRTPADTPFSIWEYDKKITKDVQEELRDEAESERRLKMKPTVRTY